MSIAHPRSTTGRLAIALVAVVLAVGVLPSPANAAGTLVPSYAPANPAAGDAITITATVTGCGVGNASTPSLYYLVSGVGVYQNDYYRTTQLTAEGDVATASITFPAGTFPSGSYTVQVYGRGTPCFASSYNFTWASTTMVVGAVTEVPGAPTDLNATPGDGDVTLTWTAPDNDGGATITDYTIEHSTDDGDTWTPTDSIGDTTSHTIDGLTNGVPHTFRIAATNSAGTGPTSTTTTATPAGVPGTPTDLNATPGDGDVTLTWTAPDNDGGATITDYTIEHSTDDGDTWTPTDSIGDTTSHTIDGLTNGVPHTFRIAATNSAGTGPTSTTTTATPVAAEVPDGGDDEGEGTEGDDIPAPEDDEGDDTPAPEDDDIPEDEGGSDAPTVSIVLAAPKVGSSVKVTGSGLPLGAVLRVEVRSDPVLLGEAPADADGNAVVEGVLPTLPAGEHTIVAMVLVDGEVVDTTSTPFSLAQVDSGGGDTLPDTGADHVALVLLALLLMGAGVTVLRETDRQVPEAA